MDPKDYIPKSERKGGYMKPGHQQPHGASSKRDDRNEKLDEKYVFDTFYDGEFLKKDVFLGKAEEAANFFRQRGVTQTSFRNIFYMLKDAQKRLKKGKMEFGEAKVKFYEVVRLVDYQVNREVIKTGAFADLFKKHLELATKNEREFIGFVEYLTSILARLKQK